MFRISIDSSEDFLSEVFSSYDEAVEFVNELYGVYNVEFPGRIATLCIVDFDGKAVYK